MNLKPITCYFICCLLPLIAVGQTLYIGDGATLHVGQGSGTVLYVDGDLQNYGHIVDDGGIEINGTASLADTLGIMIGGTTSGTDYYPIFAGGTATLTGGTLDVMLTGGFSPSVGDEFTVLDAGSLDGSFATVNLPPLSSPRFWSVNYEPTAGVMRLSVGSILPVELLDFKAVVEGEHVNLRWKTASETNADHFEVEHSVDGVSFEKIGTAKAKGNISTETSYAMLHLRPAAGVNYYRLRSVDLDGSFEYSKLVSVDMATDWQSMFQVFPNPASIELMVVLSDAFNATKEKEIQLEFLDSTGKLVRIAKVRPGVNALDVGGLAAGTYLLQAGGQVVERVAIMR